MQISQKPESDLHVEHDAARAELSLYTIPDNIVLEQVCIDWRIGARVWRVREGRSSLKPSEQPSVMSALT
jgi:hypothetical protein